MAKKIKLPTEIDGKPLSKRDAELIYEHFKELKKTGVLDRKRQFEEYFNKQQKALALLFTKPVPQATSYSPKYFIRDAQNYNRTEINNKEVTIEEFEQKIDEFQRFLYSTFPEVANIRYHPELTIENNIMNINLPTEDEMEDIENMDIAEAKEFLKGDYNIDVYDSPLKGKKK